MESLTRNIKTILAKTNVAAGTTDITDATVIDTQGYRGVRAIVLFGTITSGAVTSILWAGKDTNTPAIGTDDLEGTRVAVADTLSDKMAVCEVVNPRHRYMRPGVDRGTQNAVVNGIIVELYDPIKAPITADATVGAQEIHIAPAVGTA